MADKQALVDWYEAHLPRWSRLEDLRELALLAGDFASAKRMERKVRSLERGFVRVHRMMTDAR